MAETKERNGIWQAEFWANGKRIRKSTSIALRTDAAITADIARAIVGHDSEEYPARLDRGR